MGAVAEVQPTREAPLLAAALRRAMARTAAIVADQSCRHQSRVLPFGCLHSIQLVVHSTQCPRSNFQRPCLLTIRSTRTTLSSVQVSSSLHRSQSTSRSTKLSLSLRLVQLALVHLQVW